MMMRTNCLIVMLLLFRFAPLYSAALADTATTRRGSASLMSPLIPVNLDVNEPEVIEIANFAVSEHNKRSNPMLKLSQILSCTKLYLTIGASYSLQLLAHDGFETLNYSARVFHQTSIFNSSYQLRSFELVPPPLQ
ncbi:hypothetical protein HN51_065092 [Arachis hypogaea]|uniref:Cystatin domain-containing protein n=1 Tax=Arachis hypogaea TaxID=3818 RepID=A0A444ZD66_ARAHY|nr:cysteine proteinase inhibitor 5-like [Arachis ipaensis]XP_025647195.1 cysteine proteinase inhibitor 5-like [Arachis hypogaea]QHO06192.1 Cysteine proteinase inhibitor [Arachis hypogaea]RYR12058.1 hypothetical protein Ahy_B04g069579 [Arachis hypogaea]